MTFPQNIFKSKFDSSKMADTSNTDGEYPDSSNEHLLIKKTKNKKNKKKKKKRKGKGRG
jgi:hypothetical protein